MRIFVSIPLPYDIIDTIVQTQKALQLQECIKASWVPAPNMHITLLFLAHQSIDSIPDIINKIEASKIASFSLSLGTVELNSIQKPQLIWFKVNSPSLSLLAQSLATSLSSYFKLTRPFYGHITIARIKELYNYTLLTQFINTCSIPALQWQVEHITLQSSVLTDQGPRYTTLYTFNLCS